MASNVLEFRLRKIEKQVSTSPLAHLSDAALDAAVRYELDEMSRPFNGNLAAMADAYRISPDPKQRETAKHLDDILENFGELYPAAC